MATKTATTPTPTLEMTIKNAVKAWVKAEQSAIWDLIRAVYKGLQGVAPADRGTREAALRAWTNQAFEEEYGPGAAKDRAAHISKIFKIAVNATSDHFKKWEKAGTGFYKAYEEFAVPQVNPAKDKSSKSKPEVVTVTEGGATGTITIVKAEDVDADIAAKSVQTAQGIADAAKVGKTVTPGAGAGTAMALAGAPVFTDTSRSEMVQLWADRIDSDKRIWGSLVDHLTDPKRTILTPDMVAEVFLGISKKPTLLRNTVGLLMQTDWIAKEVQNFIENNPTVMMAAAAK